MEVNLIKKIFLFLIVTTIFFANSFGKILKSDDHSFSIEIKVIINSDVNTVYKASTGDVSGWWDHSFSEKPYKMTIEAKPGGGFYEIFNKSGDGILHATVTGAIKNKLLRMEGPLGFAGDSAVFVWTLNYKKIEKGTEITLIGNAHGTLKEGSAEAVNQVWHHFLVERLKPYVENMKRNIK